MKSAIQRIFFAHPESVQESYFEHLRFALWFAARLLGAGLAALVHAIVPALFEKTASTLICQMHARIVSRSHAAASQVEARTQQA